MYLYIYRELSKKDKGLLMKLITAQQIQDSANERAGNGAGATLANAMHTLDAFWW